MEITNIRNLYQHGGDIWGESRALRQNRSSIIDFSASINPLGSPPWLSSVVNDHLSDIKSYPDKSCFDLLETAAEKFKVSSRQIIAGNGSTELFSHVLQALLSHDPQIDTVIIPQPSYFEYRRASEIAGLIIKQFYLEKTDSFKARFDLLEENIKGHDVVFLANPNNPTGTIWDAEQIRNLALKHQDSYFIIDEAYADFCLNFESLIYYRPQNVIVVYSLTKAFAIPGIRAGLAFAEEKIILSMKYFQPPWSVNTFSQAISIHCLRETDYIAETRELIDTQKKFLMHELQKTEDLTLYPSEANFILIEITNNKIKVSEVATELRKKNILIRQCDNFAGLSGTFFRIAVRTEKENKLFLKVFNKIIKEI